MITLQELVAKLEILSILQTLSVSFLVITDIVIGLADIVLLAAKNLAIYVYPSSSEDDLYA